jgi:hypothetical protein
VPPGRSDPAHPAPVQGSDAVRAQGEAEGEKGEGGKEKQSVAARV